MLRRASQFSAVSVAAGVRHIAQLSTSNPVLQNNADARGFTNPLWVEEDDAWWYSKVANILPNEMPTIAVSPARIELYNVDQLQSTQGLDFDPAVGGHHSVKTRKRYSGAFNDTLSKFCAKHGLDNKWWLSPAEVRRRGLRIAPNQDPCVQIIEKPNKFFNVEQFDKPEALLARSFSGATGRAYNPRISDCMVAHAESLGFSYSVYFTARQLTHFGVSLPIGIQPATVPLESSVSMKLFPLEEVDRGEDFLKALQRYAVKEPTYVISGQPLRGELYDKAVAMKIKSNYWVSENELTSRGFNAKPDARYIAPEGATLTFDAYHLGQFDEESQRLLAQKIGRFGDARDLA